ncbi:unnamed protein product [Ilex paraguariensis]
MRLFQEMRNAKCEPDVTSFNTIINATLKAGNIQYAKELLTDMLQKGLMPDAFTFSILINRFSKLGQMEEATSIFDRMVACGFTADTLVYDSLLKGFSSSGEMDKIINLLHQMAAKGVVLDSEITSTILTCLCDISGDLDVIKFLPSFPQDTSIGLRVSCDELLTQLHQAHPDLHLHTA